MYSHSLKPYNCLINSYKIFYTAHGALPFPSWYLECSWESWRREEEKAAQLQGS
jgi:hypothetical protein